MTVTDETPAADVNGSEPPDDEKDGVQYLLNGAARFTIGGKRYTLRGPTIGQFKRLHAEWLSLAGLPVDGQLDGQLGWVKLLFNGDDQTAGLSDKRLPDDENDWPAWVGVATSYQLDLMKHFRDIPLALGGSVPA